MGSHDSGHPPLGVIYHPQVKTIHLPKTICRPNFKCVGYSFIRSKDIERYQKTRKWVAEITFKRNSSGMTQFDRVPMISYQPLSRLRTTLQGAQQAIFDTTVARSRNTSCNDVVLMEFRSFLGHVWYTAVLWMLKACGPHVQSPLTCY